MIDKNNLTTGFLRAMHRQPALRVPEYPLPSEKFAREAYAAPERPIGGVLTAKEGDDSGRPILDVFIAGIIPKGNAQQKGCMVRNGKPMFFTKKNILKTVGIIKEMLAPYMIPNPAEGPLSVSATFCYPFRKQDRKKSGSVPHDKTPDVENVWKLWGDVMTELGFWHDDGQISTLRLSKRWSDTPGLHLRIEPDSV